MLAVGVLAAWYALGAAPAPAPGGGAILQQIQPALPPPAASSDPGLTFAEPAAPAAPATAPFTVSRIEIVGASRYAAAELHRLVADGEGRDLTLGQLDELAARITRFYRAQGFPLARAFIPAQTIREGVVTIQIIEARYGAIRLENHSRARDSLLGATLAPLKSGDPIAQPLLEERLLRLTDVPGIAPDATLVPGGVPATSDLVVDVAAGPRLTGDAALDDYGSAYNGRARAGATVHLLEPLRHGDDLGFSVLTSGRDLNYGRIAYDLRLDGGGTSAGIAYSDLKYVLGDALADLGGHGTAATASAWLRQPFVRSVAFNLYGQLRYDDKTLHDELDVRQLHTDRHLGAAVATLSGDARDAWWGGGLTVFSLELTAGDVRFDNATAGMRDADSARTGGRYGKAVLTASRLQTLTPTTSVYLSIVGQWSDKNLDEAEKLAVGGAYTVRAYDLGALSADTGCQVSAEVRRELGAVFGAAAQAIAFVDGARVSVDEDPWARGINAATLAGAGTGLRLVWRRAWRANIAVATRLGGLPALVAANARWRAWAEVGKAF